MKQLLSRKLILSVTAIIAFAVRSTFFALFSGTMFRHYHQVQGLDMQTLLRFSEWWSPDSYTPFFTLHRFVLFLIWKLNAAQHAPDIIFILQALTGILGAIALADMTLMLTGRRKAALAAGIFYAVYLPFLVYEFSILQETFTVNTLLLALWSVFYARKKRFALAPSILAGCLLAFTLNGRPVAILFTPVLLAGILLYCRKKHLIKYGSVVIAAAAVLFIAVSIFNFSQGWRLGAFYDALPYTLEYNNSTAATPELPPLINLGWNAFKRTPMLLSVRELPENVNIYFWREKMPESRFFPGPELLIPVTIFSLIIIFASGRWKCKEGLLLWIILLAPALCGREPIGRYRLMLCPYFIYFSVTGIALIHTIKNYWHRVIAIASAVLFSGICTVYEWSRNHGLRSSDFHSWALATEAATRDPELTLSAYYDYWKKTSFRNETAFKATAAAAFRFKRYDMAERVIHEAALSGEVNHSLLNYFFGLLAVGKQDPEGVLRAFSGVDPDELPDDLRQFFFRVRQDAVKIILERQKKRLNNRP